MRVRNPIEHVNKYVSSNTEKEKSELHDLHSSSDMLTQPAQASCIKQNCSLFKSLGLLQYE